MHLLRAVETTFDFCMVYREHLAEHKILQDVLCSYGHSIFCKRVACFKVVSEGDVAPYTQ